MRAGGLRGALALLLACGFGLAVGSANAETGAAELQAPGDQPPREPREGGEGREEWWTHAREVLFSDLELSAEQSRGVDAILERQLATREREQEWEAELAAARRLGDVERVGSIRAAMRASRGEREDPHDVIEEMRALLSEEQRPLFDVNRARLVAESQRAWKARQMEQRRRRRGAPVQAE
jgi:hypothetical protein